MAENRRYNQKKPTKHDAICNHPVHGPMLYKAGNGWLVELGDTEGVTRTIEFNTRMRVQGEDTTNAYVNKKSVDCKRCGKTKLQGNFFDGLCDRCYRETDSLAQELAQIKEEWKWGSDSPNNIKNAWMC